MCARQMPGSHNRFPSSIRRVQWHYIEGKLCVKHGNLSVTSKVVETEMGRKQLLRGLVNCKTKGCVLRPKGHLVAVQSPEQPQSP